jgi:hypothetical protein
VDGNAVSVTRPAASVRPSNTPRRSRTSEPKTAVLSLRLTIWTLPVTPPGIADVGGAVCASADREGHAQSVTIAMNARRSECRCARNVT